MNKKLIALAIAAAVSAPAIALADDSTVTLYGTLNVDFENVKAEGAAVSANDIKSRNRVSSNSSNIGFRGVEPLGTGLNAWFQVESSVPVDAGGGTWASRNSAVGLNGGFGSILLGQWDSPYKAATSRLDPFGDTTIAGYTGIMGGGGNNTGGNAITGVGSIAATNFDRRVSNTLQYWTPNLAGFSARLAYGANEEKTASGINPALDPRLFAISTAYENGPLYLTLDYEEHRDFASLAANQGKDSAYKFGGSYTFGGVFTLALLGEELKYKSDASPTPTPSEVKLRNYFIAGTFKPNANAFSLTYAKRDKVKADGTDVPNSKADMVTARYGYSFSKRTEFYAMYVKIKNDDNARQDFTVNPIGNNGQGAGLLAPGADPTGFGVGFIHKF